MRKAKAGPAGAAGPGSVREVSMPRPKVKVAPSSGFVKSSPFVVFPSFPSTHSYHGGVVCHDPSDGESN